MLQHKDVLIEQNRLEHFFLVILLEIHQLPSSMIVRDVVRSDSPYTTGEFSDIWRGTHEKKDVAIKVKNGRISGIMANEVSGMFSYSEILLIE